MSKLIDAGEGYFLRLLPMYNDADEVDSLDVVIEDEDEGRDMDVILSYEKAVELRDYLNDLLR